MMNIANTYDKYDHIKSYLHNGLIFNPNAIEVAILDRWGKPIWKKERGDALQPIVWDGVDSFGCPVGSGSLMCKLTYANRQIIYVPFVFIQK